MDSPGPEFALSQRSPEFLAVLESAARLQELVPDAVVVGGTAAALYASHRLSTDHDHVLADLRDRFEVVLEALEADPGWATNRVVPARVILGNLDGIEAGVRQMIRTVPLEVTEIGLLSGARLRVPTLAESLRIKGFLVVQRNQTRDYLDLAALADRMGPDPAASLLSDMDRFYSDQNSSVDGVASQLMRQLGDPKPADPSVLDQLDSYKGLQDRWTEWSEVVAICRDLAVRMVEADL
ncbi:MAG TPA: hypothetical protein VMU63_10910 [Acidimicrobiales bacterium]|nr:hypothetical protein [Acidimicrobiales bacterium]